ncbi:MAG TPA: hypothetical protein VHW60_22220 [Caulobacteraceae bacterium]|nr:hypothetical protein [Caulobacteraceae bacterium]
MKTDAPVLPLLLQLARRRAVEVLKAILANPAADPNDRAQARSALIRDIRRELEVEYPHE